MSNNEAVKQMFSVKNIQPSMTNFELKSKEQPDFDKLRIYMNQQLPRDKEKKPYSCTQACCSVQTGGNLCCFTTPESDVDKYGLGVPLYFKFLKTTIWFLVIFLILNSFLMYIYQISYRQTENGKYEDQDTASLKAKVALTSISIGALAKPSNLFYETKDLTTPETFNVKCVSGVISEDSTYTKYGIISTSVKASFTYNMYDSTCNNNALFTLAMKNCVGKTSCVLTYSPLWFKPDCSLNNTKNKLYLKLYCARSVVKLGNVAYKKSEMSLVVVVINLIVCILFALYLIMSKITQTKTTRLFNERYSQPSTFSIKVKGCPTMKSSDLIQKLYLHFNQMVQEKGWKRNPVIDIKLAQGNTTFLLNKSIKVSQDKLVDEYELLKTKEMKGSEMPKEMDMKSIRGQINTLQRKQRKKALSRFNRMQKEVLKISKNQKKLDIAKNKPNRVLSAYVTFDTIQARNTFLSSMNTSPGKRCCLKCCKPKKFNINIFENKVIYALPPPEPTNIKWFNLQVSGKEKFIRRAISWLLTIILYVVPVAVVVVISTQLGNTEPQTIDCNGAALLTQAQALADYQSEKPINKTFCWCMNDIKSRKNAVFTVNGKDTKVCQKVLFDMAYQIGLSSLMAIVLTFTSVILNVFLKFLSIFERYSDLNEEVTSRILKSFILKFLNTALLVLFINSRTNLTNGNYDDMTPIWYEAIGYAITLTYILKIAGLLSWTFLRLFLPCVFRCLDRSCGCPGNRKTKKKTQYDLEMLYTGMQWDIDFSYSEILMSVFVCMTYSPIMPIFLLVGVIHLLILYWRDKLLFLKVYRKPPMYDDRLQIHSRKIMQWCLIMYCLIAIWVFGNKNVLEDSGNIPSVADNFTEVKENFDNEGRILSVFFERFSSPHGIGFAVILVIFIVFILIRYFFSEFFGIIVSICKKDHPEIKQVETPHGGEKLHKHQIHYTSLVQEQDIVDQLNIYNEDQKKGLEISKEEEQMLQVRLSLYTNILKNGNPSKIPDELKFSDLPTYDYRLNTDFKRDFISVIDKNELFGKGA